MLIYL
jgi:hypothetical protein